MDKNLISIIVPVYKVEPYIHKCIDSILNQTYHNFELILIDDGSPDNCPQICDEYAKIDKRIKVIHQKNQGLSGARNTGIDNSIGYYISFVDSDDVVHPQMIEILYKSLINHNADISICDFIKFNNLPDNWYNKQTNINSIIYSNIQALNQLLKDEEGVFTVSWNKLYKKDLFNGIHFPIGKLHEDEFTTYKLIYKSKIITFVNNKLYYYRQRPGSIMAEIDELIHLQFVEAKLEQLDYYKCHKIQDIALQCTYSIEFYLISLYKKCDNSKILLKKNIKKYYLSTIIKSLTVVPIKYTIIELFNWIKM